MTKLLIAAAAFLATHYVSSMPLRAQFVRLLGLNGYLLLYSAAAVATLVPMIWAYYRAPALTLWHVPVLRYAPLFVMPLALLLLVCGLLTRNPTMVGADRLLKAGEPARGILRVTRHPMMWGIALWAAAHLLARGDLASVVFFGTFLLLAASGTMLIDVRKRRSLGDDWLRFADVTSNLPFAAIASGRNRLVLSEIGWARPVAAIILYGLLLLAHRTLFGARPY